MNTTCKRFLTVLSLLAGGAMLALIFSCTSSAPRSAASEGSTQDAAASRASPSDTLAGTAWRLVQIMSMDDQIFTPEERNKYTLGFEDDGRLIVRADCNRGQGTWSVKPPSQLEFGQLATTRALCPPGSLHDRFISDLNYVRSYVLEDGHLFLATLADGAILEFEPMSP